MIKSFSCKHTEALYNTGKSTKFPTEILKSAIRKLDYLDKAVHIDDMKAPSGNRLEKLQGSLSEFYSIRINDQWRIVFCFADSHASEVKIIDYH
jgi:proteic killer suppression protein